MKIIIVFVILLGITSRGYSQSSLGSSSIETDTSSAVSPVLQNQITSQIDKPLIPGLRMRKAGGRLTLFGGFVLVGGCIILNNVNKSAYHSPTTGVTYRDDALASLGTTMMVAGVGVIIPGVILWSKGAIKHKRYLKSIEPVTSIQFKGNSLSFNCRF